MALLKYITARANENFPRDDDDNRVAIVVAVGHSETI